MAHIESFEEDGIVKKRTLLNGKKLSKLNMNSFLTYNLYTNVEKVGEELKYTLVTQNDGTTEARSPIGVLPFKMENNLQTVINLIEQSNN